MEEEEDVLPTFQNEDDYLRKMRNKFLSSTKCNSKAIEINSISIDNLKKKVELTDFINEKQTDPLAFENSDIKNDLFSNRIQIKNLENTDSISKACNILKKGTPMPKMKQTKGAFENFLLEEAAEDSATKSGVTDKDYKSGLNDHNITGQNLENDKHYKEFVKGEFENNLLLDVDGMNERKISEKDNGVENLFISMDSEQNLSDTEDKLIINEQNTDQNLIITSCESNFDEFHCGKNNDLIPESAYSHIENSGSISEKVLNCGMANNVDYTPESVKIIKMNSKFDLPMLLKEFKNIKEKGIQVGKQIKFTFESDDDTEEEIIYENMAGMSKHMQKMKMKRLNGTFTKFREEALKLAKTIYPDMSPLDISEMITLIWEGLSEKIRRRHFKQLGCKKRRYSGALSNQVGQFNTNHFKLITGKRPISPYMCYTKLKHKEVSTAHPQADFKTISLLMSTQWRCYSDDVKLEFKKKADEINEIAYKEATQAKLQRIASNSNNEEPHVVVVESHSVGEFSQRVEPVQDHPFMTKLYVKSDSIKEKGYELSIPSPEKAAVKTPQIATKKTHSKSRAQLSSTSGIGAKLINPHSAGSIKDTAEANNIKVVVKGAKEKEPWVNPSKRLIDPKKRETIGFVLFYSDLRRKNLLEHSMSYSEGIFVQITQKKWSTPLKARRDIWRQRAFLINRLLTPDTIRDPSFSQCMATFILNRTPKTGFELYYEEKDIISRETVYALWQDLPYMLKKKYNNTAAKNCVDECWNHLRFLALLSTHSDIINNGRQFTNTIICKPCSISVSCNIPLQLHYAEVHGIKFPYKCPQCCEKFTTEFERANHDGRVHPETAVQCYFCLKKCLSPYLMKAHAETCRLITKFTPFNTHNYSYFMKGDKLKNKIINSYDFQPNLLVTEKTDVDRCNKKRLGIEREIICLDDDDDQDTPATSTTNVAKKPKTSLETSLIIPIEDNNSLDEIEEVPLEDPLSLTGTSKSPVVDDVICLIDDTPPTSPTPIVNNPVETVGQFPILEIDSSSSKLCVESLETFDEKTAGRSVSYDVHEDNTTNSSSLNSKMNNLDNDNSSTSLVLIDNTKEFEDLTKTEDFSTSFLHHNDEDSLHDLISIDEVRKYDFSKRSSDDFHTDLHGKEDTDLHGKLKSVVNKNVSSKDNILPPASKRTKLDSISSLEEDPLAIQSSFSDQEEVQETTVFAAKEMNSPSDSTADKTMFDCPDCCREFSIKSELIKHAWRNHDVYTCSSCLNTFESKREFRTHHNNHCFDPHLNKLQNVNSVNWENCLKKSAICAECKEQFDSSFDFLIHEQYFHDREAKFQCSICDFDSSEVIQLKSHLNLFH